MSARPTFVVVGAGKSGTTSLHRYLGEHPEVATSRIKATNYFAHEWVGAHRRGPGDLDRVHRPATDRQAYLDLFPAGGRATGEVSPLYLYVPGTAGRLAAALGPDLRVVAILRDPVEAAHSYYRMMWRQGLETVAPFEAALDREEERIARGWSGAWHYTRRGLYARQLRPYLEAFPADRVRVYLYDDLARDAAGLMRDLYSFLGVDPGFVPDLATRHNVSDRPAGRRRRGLLDRLLPGRRRPAMWKRSKRPERPRPAGPAPPLTAAARERLRRVFRDDLAELEELLGRELPGWGGAPAAAEAGG